MDDLLAIYWAAASLMLWAGGGVSDGQLSDAVNLTCDMARLSVQQEAILKSIIGEMQKGEGDDNRL